MQNLERLTIPDSDLTGVTSANAVVGMGDEVVDVLVTLQITHPVLSDLMVVLVAPNGEEQVVHDHGDWLPDPRTRWGDALAARFPPQTQANGTWTLRIVDDVPTNVGELEGWSLELTSRSP